MERQAVNLQPRWQDLLSRFLIQPSMLPESPTSEVEPYQAQPALGLEAELAWPDALLPWSLLSPSAAWRDSAAPAAWAQAARCMAFSSPFPCCVGLAPQFLQNIEPLMASAGDFFRKPASLAANSSNTTAEKLSLPQRLAQARVSGDVRYVNETLDELTDQDARWLRQNEAASQDWLMGRFDSAKARWFDIPEHSPVVLFNQALAGLREGDVRLGRRLLGKSRDGFPDTSGWRHLVDLYLTALEG